MYSVLTPGDHYSWMRPVICIAVYAVRIRNEFPQILKPLKRSLFQEFVTAFTVYLFNQLDFMHVHGHNHSSPVI